MLDFGFSEILLTSAIALVVLGPERLPKVARQVGNWMGRARAMARQLSEQLEREVSAEEFLREQSKTKAPSMNRIEAPQTLMPSHPQIPPIDPYAPMPAHDPIPPRSPLPDETQQALPNTEVSASSDVTTPFSAPPTAPARALDPLTAHPTSAPSPDQVVGHASARTPLDTGAEYPPATALDTAVVHAPPTTPIDPATPAPRDVTAESRAAALSHPVGLRPSPHE
jgi:sec-independent protein translocase protein TatB